MRYGRNYRGMPGSGGGQIVDAVSIGERPAQAGDRAVFGHREGDLLCGTPDTQIATLVERRSRFFMLVELPSKDSLTVASAPTRQVKKLPRQLRRSLTWKRGSRRLITSDSASSARSMRTSAIRKVRGSGA